MSNSARISFTALYTGHVWQRLGLSDPSLHTTAGRVLFNALRPAMAYGRVVAGGRDLASMLAQRHVLLDHLLHGMVERGEVGQVLEIAAGLSPRGLRYHQEFPALRYVEADLPEMAAEKRRRLANRLGPLHQVVSLDALTHDGPIALERVWARTLDPRLPTAVVMEGLVHYLARPDLQNLLDRLCVMLRPSSGVLISDVSVLPEDSRGRLGVRAFLPLLAAATRGRVDLHDADGGLAGLMGRAGFAQVVTHDPDLELATANQRTRGRSVVRIVVARP